MNAWLRCVIVATLMVTRLPVASGQENKPNDELTFSQMLMQQEMQRKQEEAMIEQSIADRDSRFGILPEDVDPQVKATYQKRVDTFREDVKRLRQVYSRYHLADPIYSEDLKLVREWDQVFDQSQIHMQEWLDEMATIYRSNPTKFNNLGLTLMEIVRKEGQLDRVEHVLLPARTILEYPPTELDAPLLEAIGFIGYANNDFELARSAWDQYSAAATLPAMKLAMYRSLDEVKAAWERELQLREADKQRNNPMVEIVTSKGVLKVELFEDQAPEAVANFIYLVKNGFYSRMRIFRAVPHFGVQTGCKIGNGTGNAGYSIASEEDLPEQRDIFRGSLFFALSVKGEGGEIDTTTASSQFMIASAALPVIGKSVTVFGRVIEGQHKLGTFRKVDLTEEEQQKDPNVKTDYLIQATVEKSRDHEYKPTPTKGKLPF